MRRQEERGLKSAPKRLSQAKAGLTAFAERDAKIGPFYAARWAELSAPQLAQTRAFLGNVSSWSWGHSDFDWCCDDGKAPSYLLYMVTQQARSEQNPRPALCGAHS